MANNVAEHSNQLNLTVVALVALVAIVGLVALVLYTANVAVGLTPSTGSQLVSADGENLAGYAAAGEKCTASVECVCEINKGVCSKGTCQCPWGGGGRPRI